MKSTKRGRKSKAVGPRVVELERENVRLQRRLARVETMLEIAQKASELRGIPETARERRERLIVLAEASSSAAPSSQSERRERVLAALHSERFVNKAPAQVWAELDEDTYHCSIRTMYWILAEHGEVRARRNQLRHPRHQKPEFWPKRTGLGRGAL